MSVEKTLEEALARLERYSAVGPVMRDVLAVVLVLGRAALEREPWQVLTSLVEERTRELEQERAVRVHREAELAKAVDERNALRSEAASQEVVAALEAELAKRDQEIAALRETLEKCAAEPAAWQGLRHKLESALVATGVEELSEPFEKLVDRVCDRLAETDRIGRSLRVEVEQLKTRHEARGEQIRTQSEVITRLRAQPAETLRDRVRAALGLPANALDSQILAKVAEIPTVLAAAQEQMVALWALIDHDAGDGAPFFAERADAMPLPEAMAAVLEWHREVQRQCHEEVDHRHAVAVDKNNEYRAELDRLRRRLAETEAERDDFRRHLGEAMDLNRSHRERWDRIQPLLAAARAAAAEDS